MCCLFNQTACLVMNKRWDCGVLSFLGDLGDAMTTTICHRERTMGYLILKGHSQMSRNRSVTRARVATAARLATTAWGCGRIAFAADIHSTS